MKTVVGLNNIETPEQGSAVTVGTFDGVHLGHRALIAQAVGTAKADGLQSVVLTWDKHPNLVVHPDRVPQLLTTPERRMELLQERNPDQIVVIEFDNELSQWPAERFVEELLVEKLAARHVIVGSNWRFGKGAAGNADLLVELGRDLGFVGRPLELEEVSGERVSSSRIRKAVNAGDMELAAALLGRTFDMDGIVVHGDHRGAELGFPTANLALDPALVHPARGVYAGRARVAESWFFAAINVGVNPTFGGDPDKTPLQIEAFLLDYEGDLYGQTLRVEFVARLRDEQKFDSAEPLIEQMRLDVAETRRIVGP